MKFFYQYQFRGVNLFERLFWCFFVGFFGFLGFFRLQVEFIKCWNKLKMQIIIFIPPSADSSCSTARVALLIWIFFISLLIIFISYWRNYFYFWYINLNYLITLMSNFKVLDLVVLLSKSEMRQEASSDIFFTILDWRFCYGEFEYFPLQFQGTNFGQKLLVEWTKSRKKNWDSNCRFWSTQATFWYILKSVDRNFGDKIVAIFLSTDFINMLSILLAKRNVDA